MANQIDKGILKSVVKEILLEDTQLFKSIIREILIENDIIVSDEQQSRRTKLESMIQEDFDRFDTVFQKLA